jgi:CheY-like chemotaxis protein
MDEQLLGRLFRPFVQADSSNTRRQGGLGLGLAISQRLCQLMGGSISVASQPGRGTTCTIDLPMNEVEAPAPIAIVTSSTPQPSADLRVLVVEDNKVNRLIILGMLKQMGCHVDVAEDGIEGVQKAMAGDYNIIFMDVQMPRMDGITATRAIRGSEARIGRKRTPIAGLTCLSQPEDRARGFAAGMDEYLTKPIQSQALVSVLRSCVSPSHPHPAHPATQEASSSDLSQLQQLEDASPGTGISIARTMMHDLAMASQTLPSLLQSGDLDRLGKEAHKLKGASGSVGGHAFALSCAKLESAARNNDSSTCHTALEALMRDLPAFQTRLQLFSQTG